MGKTLGPLDMQIAAHAVALGAILISNDKAFQTWLESRTGPPICEGAAGSHAATKPPP